MEKEIRDTGIFHIHTWFSGGINWLSVNSCRATLVHLKYEFQIMCLKIT